MLLEPSDGATLSKDQAVPYIVNFSTVDVSGESKVTAVEAAAPEDCQNSDTKNNKTQQIIPY